MEGANVDAIRRVYAEVNQGFSLPRELFAPEYEVDARDTTVEFADVVRGFDPALAALREYWGTFEDFRTDLDEVIHADERTVVTVILDSGRVAGSDAFIRSHIFHVWTFDEGLIVRLSIHTERQRALDVAGLSG